MTELVTVAEAKLHLRADTADEPWLAIFIPGISEAVLDWLKDIWRAYEPERDANGVPIVDSSGDQIPILDSNGEMTPRPQVKVAVLLELAYQFRFREGEGDHTATGDLYSGRYGYTLSRGATSILSSLRKSTVA